MSTVLVTGASTGVGLALAELLYPLTEHTLVLTARTDSLSRFADAGIVESARVLLRPLDVTVDDERRALIDEIESRCGGVDALINNAGVAYRSVVEHVTERERLEQMGINFRSPMEMARLVLPSMRRRRAGRIINVSSVGGMMAMPTMSVYSASKFALEGATEALYYEVRPWNIKVSLIEPGFIHSTSFQKVHYTSLGSISEEDPADPYHQHYRHMTPFIEKMMGLSMSTPEKVAARIVRTIHNPDPPLRVRVTIDAYVFDLMRRFLPRRLYHWILYRSLPGVSKWGHT